MSRTSCHSGGGVQVRQMALVTSLTQHSSLFPCHSVVRYDVIVAGVTDRDSPCPTGSDVAVGTLQFVFTPNTSPLSSHRENVDGIPARKRWSIAIFRPRLAAGERSGLCREYNRRNPLACAQCQLVLRIACEEIEVDVQLRTFSN